MLLEARILAFETVVARVEPGAFVLTTLDLLSRVLSQRCSEISCPFLVAVLDDDFLIRRIVAVVADQPILAPLGDLELVVQVA